MNSHQPSVLRRDTLQTMARRRRFREPISVKVDRLEPRGSSGLDESGQRWVVRGASVGATVRAQPGRKQKGRLLEEISPASDSIKPRCSVFGVCGGCQLQAMPLPRQRAEKEAMVSRLVGDTNNVTIHPISGTSPAYGYRNKVELSFGPKRFLSEAEMTDDTISKEGNFLGFHPPGWFSRIVPLSSCPLASEKMNAVISLVSEAGCAPAWDNQSHTGVWRHLVIREGDGILVTLVTTTTAPKEEVVSLGDRIAQLPGVTGVLWARTDRLSDVAIGDELTCLHGDDGLQMSVGHLRVRLPHDGFFQVNLPAARHLFDQIGTALGSGGTLLDLYCGVGAIGLYLAAQFDRIIGIELNPASIACAQKNAKELGIEGEWHAGAVEKMIPLLAVEGMCRIVVDPPRAGLHPRVVRFLASHTADVLVYVACNVASLGRDRVILEEGGWRLTDLWSNDLFPQTPHVEAIGRFVRRP